MRLSADTMILQLGHPLRSLLVVISIVIILVISSRERESAGMVTLQPHT